MVTKVDKFIIGAGILVILLQIIRTDFLGDKLRATDVVSIALLTVTVYTHIKDMLTR